MLAEECEEETTTAPPSPQKPCPDSDCSICLEPMCAGACGNEAIATLPCNHKFHVACVLKVARSNDANHGRCPLCRAVDPAHEQDETDDEMEAVPEPSVRESSHLVLLSGGHASQLSRALWHVWCRSLKCATPCPRL